MLMNTMKAMSNYQYSMRDFHELLKPLTTPFDKTDDNFYYALKNLIAIFYTSDFQDFDSLFTADEKPNVIRLARALGAKYADSIIIESEHEYENPMSMEYDTDLNPDDREAIAYFFRRMMYMLIATKERYCAILNAYNANKANLMREIKSSSVSRFLDTPQVEGDFSADANTSHITKGESSTEGATPIERLSEIERAYSDVVDNWVNEFKDLFIEY